VIVLASTSTPATWPTALVWWGCAFLYALAAITRLDSYPSWSPDGQNIVFASRSRAGDWEIYRFTLGENSPVRLTDRLGSDTTPVFSPDGLEIYFRTDTSGSWQVRAMAVDGTHERVVKRDVGPSDDWGLARPTVH
jgi:Tol biopolymer transport system component